VGVQSRARHLMRRETGGRGQGGVVPGVQMFVRLVVARGVLLLLLRLPERRAHIRQRGAAHVAAQAQPQPHGGVAPVVVRGREVRHGVAVLREFVRLCGVLLGVAVFRGEGAPRGDEGRHQHRGATVGGVVVVGGGGGW
jgi:hypothetical protein